MRRKFHTFLLAGFLLWAAAAAALPKLHVITFGKWTPAKWYVGLAEGKSLDIKIRALYVDARLKEYTTGAPHEVTDRLFVVRRIFASMTRCPQRRMRQLAGSGNVGAGCWSIASPGG
jgi:hypothetical protein